jgi:hypothetical protein
LRHLGQKFVGPIARQLASRDIAPEVKSCDDPVETDFMGQFEQ